MDASDLMDSDQRIMGATTVRNGVLSFDFGDGSPPLRGQLDGALNSKQIIQWCNAVRSAYRARQDSKENQTASPASDVQAAPRQDHAPAPISGGGGLPVEAGVEGVKAAMEAGIESALTGLGGRAVALRERQVSLRDELSRLDKEQETLEHMVQYYVKLREAL